MLNEFSKVDLILNFTNREDIIISKLMGRRVCPECNKNFNVCNINDSEGYVMPPLLPKGDDPTLCDGDHQEFPVKLVQREDDKVEIIKDRLELYRE